jgi:hypothetical protein
VALVAVALVPLMLLRVDAEMAMVVPWVQPVY